MAPPPAGNYYIKNKATGYFLTSQGKDPSSTTVKTTDPSGKLGPELRFNLRKADSDLYVISASMTGANVGSPAHIVEGQAIIWTPGEQLWRISDAGPGVYSVRLVEQNRFWHTETKDNTNCGCTHPAREVVLKNGMIDDTSYWIFQTV